MRPLYETAANLSDEEVIVTQFVSRSSLFDRWRKLPFSYNLDFALLQDDPRHKHGRVVAYAEAKARNWLFGSGDGYYLAEQKVRAAKLFKAVDGLQSYLVVRFADGIIRWCPMNVYGDEIIIAGRTDRNDPADLEPHVIYNWAVFCELKG